MTKALLKKTFDEPNHTQTPNKFFDMIPEMGEAELRVTLVMIRHTFGYHKESFKMSMQKLADASGMSRQGAINGALAAEERGIFKRANPDSQKEAEWELNLLPVNDVDPSTTLTGSVNDVDSTCKPSLQQSSVKENYKENKEETQIPQNMPIEWYIEHGLPIPEKLAEQNRLVSDATNEFESALGFGQLPWDSVTGWQTFKKWVVKTYQSDPQTFRKYAEWRSGKGKYDAMSNKQIRQAPSQFIDTGYPAFMAHIVMSAPKQDWQDRSHAL